MTGPSAGPSWEGQSHALGSPPDTTGAIGPGVYLQLINDGWSMYDRDGATLSGGLLDYLTGYHPHTLVDPQVIWDATTERFYYVVADIQRNTLAWGFSKTAEPTAVRGQWCRYVGDFGYASGFPDYPKLGDTADFLLVGANAFKHTGDTLGPFVSSDLLWIPKPSPGPITECPAQDSFALGRFAALTSTDGTPAFTPVPANQIDGSGTGYVVAAGYLYIAPGASGVPEHASQDYLTVFEVTKDHLTGAPLLSPPKRVSVPAYSIPPNAPQPGTNNRLDTLDGRFRQAVAAVDPRLGRVAVWTSHAVFGGAGSEERWYEIDAARPDPTIFRSGVVSHPSLYVWNGAISSDRVVGSAGSGFGSSMVLGFNTSSPTDFVAIQMVSKIEDAPQSGLALVQQSPGYYEDFACENVVCRWGDYSGAAPDPSAPLSGATGKIWLTGQWNSLRVDGVRAHWRTWNWGALP